MEKGIGFGGLGMTTATDYFICEVTGREQDGVMCTDRQGVDK